MKIVFISFLCILGICFTSLASASEPTTKRIFFEQPAFEASFEELYRCSLEGIQEWNRLSSITNVEFNHIEMVEGSDIVFTTKSRDWFYEVGESNSLGITAKNLGKIYSGKLIVLANDNDDCQLIKNVAIHELGHAIGLNHSKNKSSIMFAFLDKDDSQYLTKDDLWQVHKLYEYNPKSKKPWNKWGF